MTPSTDLRQTIRNALARQGLRPVPARAPQPKADWTDPPRDPDWAIREIVDEVMFQTAR